MELKDYYQILGVNHDTSSDDIKKAYRRLAMQHHPDRNPENTGEAEAKFKEINEAYEILSNEELRWRYDSFSRLSGYSSKTVPPDSFGGVADSDIALEMLLRVARMGKRCGRGMCRRQWR